MPSLSIFFILLIIAIILILMILVFIKIKVSLRYIRKGTVNMIELSFEGLKGLIAFHYVIPMDKDDMGGKKIIRLKKWMRVERAGDSEPEAQERENILMNIGKVWSFIHENGDVFNKTFKGSKGRLEISRLSLEMVIGTGNAAYTGILTGLAWTLYGILLSQVSQFIVVKQKEERIIGEFSKRILTIDITCIFHARPVHIILAGLKIQSSLSRKSKKIRGQEEMKKQRQVVA